MVGRQLPFFSVLVPFWLVWAFAGCRGMVEVWPAILVAGLGIRRAAVSRVELSRTVARGRRRVGRVAWRWSRCSCASGSRRSVWTSAGARGRQDRRVSGAQARAVTGRAGRRCQARVEPWIILSVVVFVWGIPATKAWLDGISVDSDSGAGAAPDGDARASCRCRTAPGGGGLRRQLAVGDRHRHLPRRDHRRPDHGVFDRR